MSRMIKKDIPLPQGVTATFQEGVFKVSGPKGILEQPVLPEATVTVDEQNHAIRIEEGQKTKQSTIILGTTFSLVRNLIQGVHEGYTKILELEGIGYRAAVEGREIAFSLGFSHPVRFPLPEGIECKVEKNTITLTGIDKQLVGEVAAKIRDLKKPEPYKGKGIHYQGEIIRRKAGKKAVASG